MERKRSEIDKEKQAEIKERAARKGGLAEAMWNLAENRYSDSAFTAVWEELTRICGREPHRLARMEEFWVPEMKKP